LRFPVLGAGWHFGFGEVAQRHGDYAMAIVALAVRLEDGSVVEARVAAGAVSDRPIRLTMVEAAIVAGVPPNELRSLAAESVDPPDSPHAPSAYRRSLVGTLVVRALAEALA